MTNREQILKILNGEKPDKVPWFGDLDYWATALVANGKKPKNFQKSPEYIDWHRDLGVGYYLQGYFPYKAKNHFQENTWYNGNLKFREIITPKGNLKECWEYVPDTCSEAPREHLVKSVKDLAALRYVYENIEWEPDYDFALERIEQIGDMGISLLYLPHTPYMQLLVIEAGVEAVTYCAMDEPDELAETLQSMKKSFDHAAQIAIDGPTETLMIPENLSSEMVGPDNFEKYMRNTQTEWVEKMKKAGKFSFLHMDGTLKGLLAREASTGFTVIEAMTPFPVGDLAIEEWESVANNPKTIFWGGMPGSYFTANVTDHEFDRHVRAVLAVMRKNPRYVLGVADQVPPDALEYRVKRVRELVDQFGAYE